MVLELRGDAGILIYRSTAKAMKMAEVAKKSWNERVSCGLMVF